MESKIYARNREAEYNYFIEDKYEAGMVLTGIEAKSIVMGKANLRGSYITIRNGECFLRQSHISLLDTINGFDKVENKLKSDLQKGHLSFILNGKKLKGEFALIKLKTKQENAWLLIKSKDQYAIDEDVLLQDKSVISNMTLENIEKKNI